MFLLDIRRLQIDSRTERCILRRLLSGVAFSAARSTSEARWQSGYAADCNSVYAGSIPTLASNFFKHLAPLLRGFVVLPEQVILRK